MNETGKYTEIRDDGIKVTLTVEFTDDGPVCRKLKLSAPNGSGIPAMALRRIELPRMLRAAAEAHYGPLSELMAQVRTG